MATRNLSIRLSVKDAEVVRRALEGLGDEGQQALKRLERGFHGAEQSADRFHRSVNNASSGITQLRGAIASLGAGMLLREFVELTTLAQNLDSRLRLVTESTEDFASAQQALFQLAQSTRSPLEETVSLYSQMARVTEQLNLSQGALIEVTQAVNQASRVSGSSMQAAAAAVMQFGQALSKGKADGDEFNSIMENNTFLAMELSKGLVEIGVASEATTGELYRLREEGLLTTNNLLSALAKRTDEISEAFEKVPRTIKDAIVQLQNQLIVTVGAMDEASGATKRMAESIDEVREIVADPAFREGLAAIGTMIAWIARQSADAVRDIGNFVSAVRDLDFGDMLGAIGEYTGPGWAARFFGLWEDETEKVKANSEFAGAETGFLADEIARLKALLDQLNGSTDDNAKATKELADSYITARNAALDQADQLQLDVDLYGLSAAEQARMRVEWELTNEALRQYGSVSPQVRSEIKAIADDVATVTQRLEARKRAAEELEKAEQEQAAASERAAREAKRAQEEAQQAITRATDAVVDDAARMLAEISADWRGTWSTLSEYLLDVMRRTFAQLAAEAIIRPLIQPVVGSVMGGGAPGGAAGAGSVGDAFTFGRALSGVRGAWSHGFLGAETQAGIGNLALRMGLGRTGANMLVRGANFAPWGIGGTMAASLLGLGKGTGGQIGGGLGSFAGGAIGGPLGALVGGFAGSALGGLFGGSTTTKFRPDISATPGGVRTPFGWLGGRGKGVDEEPIVQALAGLYDEIANTLVPAEIDRVAKELQNTSFRQERGDINVATLIGDQYRAVFRALGLDQDIGDQFGKIDDPDQRAAALQGILEARQAVMAFVDAADADKITAAEQALKDLRAQFDEVSRAAKSLGMPLGEITAAYQEQVAALRRGFVEGIEDQALMLTDPRQAELRALQEEITTMAEEARALGVFGQVADDIARIRDARFDDIMERYADKTVEATEKIARTFDREIESISGFISDRTASASSPLAPERALANARGELARLINQAEIGDAAKIADLTPQILDAAGRFADLNRQVNASSPQFFSGERAMLSALERLRGEMAAASPAAVMREVGEQSITELRGLRKDVQNLRAENSRLNAEMRRLADKVA